MFLLLLQRLLKWSLIILTMDLMTLVKLKHVKSWMSSNRNPLRRSQLCHKSSKRYSKHLFCLYTHHQEKITEWILKEVVSASLHLFYLFIIDLGDGFMCDMRVCRHTVRFSSNYHKYKTFWLIWRERWVCSSRYQAHALCLSKHCDFHNFSSYR